MRVLFLLLFLVQPLCGLAANTLNIQEMDIQIKTIPEFIGGLKVQEVGRCEKFYAKKCPVINAKNFMDGVDQQWPCIEQKLAKDKLCKQAAAIRKYTGFPINEVRQYGKITVFNVLYLADGQYGFYLIDTAGKLIMLTQNNNLVDKNPVYLKLKKHYPEISLTDFLFWHKPFENIFPQMQIKGNLTELTFKQELRDYPCVACKPVGIAYIVYRFNYGKFINVQLLKIEALPENFSR